MVRFSCLSVVGLLLACSDDSNDDGGAAGGIAAAGSAGVAGAPGGGSAGSGGAGPSPSPGGASAGGTSSELGIGGAVELEPSAGAGGDGPGGGEVVPDAGPPALSSAICPPGPFVGNPLDGVGTPQTVCTGLTFAEGTVWFAERNELFFSDFQLGNPLVGRIMSYTPGGACEVFIEEGGTNGLVIAPDGNLLGARHSDRTLTFFDLDTREPTVLVADNDGLAFNSPNDIAVRSDGNIYFTDPNYLAGGRPSEQPTRAYRRDPSGALTVIDETGNTNGINLSPDESRLYLAHLGAPNDIVVFDVAADGSLSEPQPFANVGSDGMAVDCAGNLYTTGGPGVRVFSPEGDALGTIAAQGAANLAFGGPERRTLYIAATTTLRALELPIPGLPY